MSQGKYTTCFGFPDKNCFYKGISVDLMLYCIMCPASADFFCSSSLLCILDVSIMYLGIM